MLMTSTTETYFDCLVIKTRLYIYHKIRTEFSKFYQRHLELQYWFKNLLQQGISEPIFYGDFVYKFKRNV